ncbi:MAG: molybdopterin converting factor subunit 1 [bacterium]
MIVSVRLFAMLRERAGSDRIELELDDGATADDALAALADHPQLAELAGRLAIRVAVNREYVDGSQPLRPGDELALIPPVSGGSL